MTFSNKTNTEITLSTYGIYNSGSLRGFTLDLSDCYNQEDIDDAIKKGMEDIGNANGELMIQDIEGPYIMRKMLERNGICQWLFNLHEFITENEYEIDKINLAFDDGAYNLSNELNKNPDYDLKDWLESYNVSIYDADNIGEAYEQHIEETDPDRYDAVQSLRLHIDWVSSANAPESIIRKRDIDGSRIYYADYSL